MNFVWHSDKLQSYVRLSLRLIATASPDGVRRSYPNRLPTP